jgi:hypothetical protein
VRRPGTRGCLALGAATLTILCLGAGCSPAPGPRDSETTMEQTIQLGQWRKATRTPCSERYPDRLLFREGGIYTGHTEPPGAFTHWDVGTFEVVGPDRVEISTANDAVVSYTFTASGDTLSFRDPEGCDFEYVKTD